MTNNSQQKTIFTFLLDKKSNKKILSLIFKFLISWPEPVRRTDEIIFDFKPQYFDPENLGSIYLTNPLLLLMFDEPHCVSVSLSWPQPLVLCTRLGGHSRRPTLKSLPGFSSLATIRAGVKQLRLHFRHPLGKGVNRKSHLFSQLQLAFNRGFLSPTEPLAVTGSHLFQFCCCCVFLYICNIFRVSFR